MALTTGSFPVFVNSEQKGEVMKVSVSVLVDMLHEGEHRAAGSKLLMDADLANSLVRSGRVKLNNEKDEKPKVDEAKK